MDREEFETALDAAIADGTMGEGAEILREQYIVYAANQGFEYFDDMADLVGQFEDAYMGEWDSFREYSDDYVESTGMLGDVNEQIQAYFDYESFARDLLFDHWTEPSPGHGVYIFRSF